MRAHDDEETGEAIDAREAVVAWALSQVGDRDPNEYYRVVAHQFADKGAEHSVSWCGVFALAALRACGLCDWTWSSRASEPGFVWRLPVVAFPEKGDIAVFRKGADGRDVWHHAIVKHVENGRADTVDGNVLPYPREGVAERTRPIDANVTFYSIAGLLRDA
jgi:hypothetical protein